MNFFFIFIFNVVFRTSCSLNNSFSQMHQRSVASEVAVYFNFGFSGFNMDSSSISQYALTDLLTHLRNSVTVGAFNQEASQKSENLTISKLEIDEIVFVNNNNIITWLIYINIYWRFCKKLRIIFIIFIMKCQF